MNHQRRANPHAGHLERWKREQGELLNALANRLGDETYRLCVKWPEGQQPQVDEVEGELVVVQMPTIAKDISQSRKVTLNFNAADALQAVEALFTEIDRERGLTLWPEFLQLAADHPQSPKASRVQTELAVDLDDDDDDSDQPALVEPTPIEAGESSQPEQRPDPTDPGDPSEHRLSRGRAWPFNWRSELMGRFVVGRKQGKAIVDLVCRPNPITDSRFTSRPAPWPVISRRNVSQGRCRPIRLQSLPRRHC